MKRKNLSGSYIFNWCKVEELDKVPKHVQKESGGLFFMKEDGKIVNFMVKGN